MKKTRWENWYNIETKILSDEYIEKEKVNRQLSIKNTANGHPKSLEHDLISRNIENSLKPSRNVRILETFKILRHLQIIQMKRLQY